MRQAGRRGAIVAPSRIMDFLSDKFALKSPPAAAGKGGEFYLPPGAPLEHVMEALDGGGGSEAFYGKGGKCVAQAAYNPHGRLDRASPGRDSAGECLPCTGMERVWGGKGREGEWRRRGGGGGIGRA